MDASQYCWPFAWKYSIWNARVSALQFWTADLEPHVLSNAIDQVYTAFFCSDAQHTEIYQKKYSLVTSWPPWMTHLNLSLHRKMKVMRVEVKTSTSQPHSAEPWESAMCPRWMIYPSIWQTLVDHLQHQSSMPSPHLTNTETTTSPTANWSSPAQIMRAP